MDIFDNSISIVLFIFDSCDFWSSFSLCFIPFIFQNRIEWLAPRRIDYFFFFTFAHIHKTMAITILIHTNSTKWTASAPLLLALNTIYLRSTIFIVQWKHWLKRENNIPGGYRTILCNGIFFVAPFIHSFILYEWQRKTAGYSSVWYFWIVYNDGFEFFLRIWCTCHLHNTQFADMNIAALGEL